MVKVDVSRDYYADLEISPDASGDDIKKQFRKLALKFHPDRNPGKELEYNPRFQAIQAAHEVLGDPEQRAKYDAARRRPPVPDGPRPTPPRGNPYQARSDFPPPKMRSNNNMGNSGTDRRTNFPPPPTRKDKQGAGAEARERANAYNAWQNMHNSPKPQQSRQQDYSQQSGYQGSGMRPQNPPREGTRPGRAHSASDESPPRTAYDETRRQRAGIDRSASTRAPPPPPRGGFDPSSGAGDEGPAPSHTYYERAPDRARRRSPPTTGPSQMPGSYARPPPPPPPAPQSGPGQFQNSRLHRQPPMNNGRAPFDPPYVEATRERTPYMNHSDEKTYFSTESLRAYANAAKSPQEEPFDNDHRHHSSQQRRPHSASPPHKMPDRNTNRPSKDSSHPTAPPFEFYTSPDTSENDANTGFSGSDPSTRTRRKAQPSPSWTKNRDSAPPLGKSRSFEAPPRSQGQENTQAGMAPQPHGTIFTMPIDSETFTSTKGFVPRSQSSTSIDTNFASAHGPVPFSSNGSADEDGRQKSGHQGYFTARGRAPGRPQQSPAPADGVSPDLLSPQSAAHAPAHSPGVPFSADHWRRELQDENWTSPLAQGPPFQGRVSPTRASTNSRKARGGGIRAGSSDPSSASHQPTTPQPASIAEEETGDPDRFTGRNHLSKDDMDAMDIDSTPPTENGTRPSMSENKTFAPQQSQQQQQQPPPTRHVYVEPSRPDWRDSRVNDERRASIPSNIPPPPPNPPSSSHNRGPSLSMNDFRHVPPFQNKAPGAGLEDMEDMSNNLPFPSRATPTYPDKLPPTRPPALELPPVPRAPQVPDKIDRASWTNYLDFMGRYLSAWNAFNKQMADYFGLCAIQQIDMQKGRGMVNDWLAAVGETGSLGGWDTYCRRQKEQQRMRTHWQVASERHQDAIEAHTKLRDRIMGTGMQ